MNWPASVAPCWKRYGEYKKPSGISSGGRNAVYTPPPPGEDLDPEKTAHLMQHMRGVDEAVGAVEEALRTYRDMRFPLSASTRMEEGDDES